MESSWAPLGVEAPPLPSPLWPVGPGKLGQCRQVAVLCTLHGLLSRLRGLCQGTGCREGALHARPPCGQLGKISGRAPCPHAAASVSGWTRGLRCACGNSCAMVTPSPAAQDPGPLCTCRLWVPGTWQLHKVGFSFFPFQRGENCSPGWLSRLVQSRAAGVGRALTARVRHMAPADRASEGPRLEDPSAPHPLGKSRRGACAGSEPPLLPLTATP